MEHKHLGKGDTAFMAACTGLIVANIYYCQPLIVLIAKEWALPESAAGRVTYLTQIGYALGLLLIVPMGDILERRKQILLSTGCSVVALLLAATAPNFLTLQIASVLIGISSIVPQLILPLAAHLTADHKRGSTIGTIMAGLLVGILASRSLSGAIGSLYGWRAMYYIAAGVCLVLMLLMRLRFPKSQPSFKGHYGHLMKSVAHYAMTQPLLRQAAITNALSFAVVSAFWVTMVLFLSRAPFGFKSFEIGLFGLAGAAGALAAPLVGKISDGRDPGNNIIIGLICELLSFIGFYFTGSGIFLLLAGIIILDVGHQSVQVTNQTIIYSILPEARNRFNTVFMTSTFIGGATGSALGLFLWNIGQWPMVCAGCSGVILVNIFLFFRNKAKAARNAELAVQKA
ncbi:MFS transporter [Chitinophaga ginsengisoli]|uniref:Putative MFS family arabinose efflux permease n=1 Tax=Chitinophaga ginsengisoli TaxID=363837 RepID=A0A2P8GQ47_9BACT|nr:MFS transporter [Chitinophaga ginsengisoli]PSL36081.1 putative MFS family arabinose efflux permease [Chitinophaga ginsengisoli]